MINFLSLIKKSPGEISPNFDSERNDFDLHKGFLMEKIIQIRQISKK
jgi:hypothetical protein